MNIEGEGLKSLSPGGLFLFASKIFAYSAYCENPDKLPLTRQSAYGSEGVQMRGELNEIWPDGKVKGTSSELESVSYSMLCCLTS